MRLVLFISLLSLKAHACPDLSGKYICSTASEDYSLEVSQSEDGEFIQYHFSTRGRDLTYISDGVLRPLVASKTRDISVRAHCTKSSLKTEKSGSAYHDGTTWSVDVQMEYFRIKDSLYINGKSLIRSLEGKTIQEPINDSCQAI